MTQSIDLDETTAPWSAAAPVLIHVRFAGVNFDLPLSSLDIGTGTSDPKVKRAVATRLMITPDRLDGHVIDRQPDGNLRIRPSPVDAGKAGKAMVKAPAPDARPGLFSLTLPVDLMNLPVERTIQSYAGTYAVARKFIAPVSPAFSPGSVPLKCSSSSSMLTRPR
jgi:hypothetical protein